MTRYAVCDDSELYCFFFSIWSADFNKDFDNVINTDHEYEVPVHLFLQISQDGDFCLSTFWMTLKSWIYYDSILRNVISAIDKYKW